MQAPDLAQLGRLTGLRTVLLEHLVLSDDCCAALAPLSGLRRLSLMGTEGVRNEGLLAMSLGAVTQLDLAWTDVTLIPLLPELQVGSLGLALSLSLSLSLPTHTPFASPLPLESS